MALVCTRTYKNIGGKMQRYISHVVSRFGPRADFVQFLITDLGAKDLQKTIFYLRCTMTTCSTTHSTTLGLLLGNHRLFSRSPRT